MKRISIMFLLMLLLLLLLNKAEAQSILEPRPEERVFTNPVNAPFISVWDKVPQEISNRNSFKRLEWFYRSRLDEKGVFPKEHINKEKSVEKQKIQEKMNSGNLSPRESAAWTNIGPTSIDMTQSFVPYWGNVSGRIRGIDVHPTNPDIVYIGVAAGGIWKTTNGGQNWIDKSGDLNLLTFGAIAIDPSNPETIYAGSGEAIWFFNTTTFEGDGLYKSTNGGDNWTRITNGFGSQTQFSNIDVSHSNPDIILASLGTGNYNNQGVTNQGVWRSSDAGLTWTRVINQTGAFDVAFHPSNGSLAYAVIGNKVAAAGFYVSTDAGVTWTNSSTGLTGSYLYMGRLQFDISPSNPSTLYTVVYNDLPISGNLRTCAYKSTNGGASWAQISFGINIAGTYDGSTVSDQGSYNLCIAVNPTNPNNVFIGNVELSKTNDGSNFSFIRNPSGYNGGVGAWASYSHVDIHNVIFAPSNSNILYVCCDGGIYKSTNGGTDFFHINNGINTIQFYRVASHPTNPSVLYGGAQDNGNFSTTDKGATSWKFETSGDGMECFVDYSNPNNIFISTQYGSLSKSTDAGSTWTNVVGSSSSSTAWTAPFWQHPTVPNVLYAAYGRGIIRSLSGGNTGTWSFIASSVTTSPNRITSVAHSSVNTNNLIAVASYYTTPQIFKSTNEGISTWTNITSNVTGSGFTGSMIHRAIAHPNDANTFYLTRASYTTGQIIKTTNFGTNWIDISGDLPSITVSDLFIDPLNTEHLYAGNDFGVYFSANGGTNWSKLNIGMPFVPVLDFSFYNNGGTRYLRAATHGRGIYEITFDTPLPVTLSSFTYSVYDRNIKLNWSTSQEVNNAGFHVQRSVVSSHSTEWQSIGFIEGSGTKNTQTSYVFEDRNLNTGKYKYRLKQVDNNGNYEYHALTGTAEVGLPKRFELRQNYPNPFNPATKIDFELPVNSKVTINIYDVSGRKIKELLNETKYAGYHTTEFNAAGFSSGIYFYSITAESTIGLFNKTVKMILTK